MDRRKTAHLEFCLETSNSKNTRLHVQLQSVLAGFPLLDLPHVWEGTETRQRYQQFKRAVSEIGAGVVWPPRVCFLFSSSEGCLSDACAIKQYNSI